MMDEKKNYLHRPRSDAEERLLAALDEQGMVLGENPDWEEMLKEIDLEHLVRKPVARTPKHVPDYLSLEADYYTCLGCENISP